MKNKSYIVVNAQSVFAGFEKTAHRSYPIFETSKSAAVTYTKLGAELTLKKLAKLGYADATVVNIGTRI